MSEKKEGQFVIPRHRLLPLHGLLPDDVKREFVTAFLDGYSRSGRATLFKGDERHAIYIDGGPFANLTRSIEQQTLLTLPTLLEILLILMSKARRNDILNDMADWYPEWAQEHGRFGAILICWCKVMAAVFSGLLDIAMRIGEIVNKFRGAK